ncbi:MAG: glycosyltransferase [Spirochaetaceae bacterium]|nr:MAG: glycosyltransferase [Spirochaetaceae bacterium]
MGTPPRLLPHDARERVTQRLCRFKNCYAVNNNGARNAALEDGVTRAPWVLPWDGNCMLTAEGWESIRTAILERPWYPYWIVPMARVRSITELRPGAPPPAATEEPQIIFRRDAGERFNPDAYYGRRPKVELLWRLGVSGPWDHWYREPWDLPYPHYASDAGAWQRAGWVARLPSGNAAAEAGRGNQIRRRSTREEAITAFLHRCDQRFGTRYPIPARRVAVHISTVHHATDPRIRLKQLRGLRERGWEAHLVTADRTAAASGVAADGVIVHRIRPLRGGRLWRMVITAPRAILRALAVPADIYQLHDPELLPWAWLLLLRGAPVFYDIHEDYALAVAQKRYLPGPLRRPAAAIVAALERALSVPFSLLIAERCYRGRFPRAMDLLNYPERRLLELGPAHDPAARHLLYTGNVTEDRGALLLARLVAHLPEVEVTLVGRCDPRLAERMRRVAGEGAGRLHLVGEGRFVPFAEICSAYTGRKWSAGIALMPDTPHYRDKELTKFFEYMAVGLPIIASDVPVWRRLIADGGVGVCVPPDDPAAVAAVLRRLTAHPHLGEQMSLRAQHLVEKRYHWDGQVDRLVIRYMQVLHEA